MTTRPRTTAMPARPPAPSPASPPQASPQASLSSLTRPSAAAGFTIIEVLVVVSVIAILAGALIVAAGGAYSKRAKVLRTKGIMNSLVTASETYKAAKGRYVNHFSDASQYDWDSIRYPSNLTPPATSYSNDALKDSYSGANAVKNYRYTGYRFIFATYSLADCKKLILGMDSNLLKDWDGIGYLGVVDGWDHPIVYLSVVSTSDSCSYDDIFPARSAPYFVSAGPDGEFGDVRTSATAAEQAQAADNIYSFTGN